MKEDVYIHGEGLKEPKIIKIARETRVSEIVKEFEGLSGIISSSEAEVELFFDNEEPVDKNASASDLKIKKRSHIHCHRCKKAVTHITYNGVEEKIKFSPNTLISKVFKKALKAFEISESDASNLVLRIGSGQGDILNDDDHIGTFVDYPKCKVDLFLTPKKQVQGEC
jgi:hypothetical protein